jgi:hypothetical protein
MVALHLMLIFGSFVVLLILAGWGIRRLWKMIPRGTKEP